MSDQIKIYDFSISEEFSNFFGYVSYLKEKGATVELKEIKKTRSYLQNRSLHLFLTFCADALNNAGVEFCYRGLKGMDIEIPWNGDLFKAMVWKPIQITLFDFESTTKLKTSEINQILDILTRHFSSIGLSISFPCQFDLWIKQIENKY